MTDFNLILTHPGGAHKDEFLACSVLLALHPVPVVRREPLDSDLVNTSVCVVDVGHRHEPQLNNFDHHQLDENHPPTCSLSLVLQHLGIYSEARRFCSWLETAEWFDCRGAITTARWLKVEADVLPQLASPIDATLLRRFALVSRLDANDPLWLVMRMIGEDLLDHVKCLRDRVDFIGRHAEIWDLEFGGGPARVLFLPRTEPLPEEPSLGIEHYIASRGLEREVVGTVYPDRRSCGYGLARFKDNPRLNFARIAGRAGVHFTHKRGFVAKTILHEVSALKMLLVHAGTEVPAEATLRV